MASPDKRSFGLGSKSLVTIASFVVVVAGLKAAGTLILPFLVAVFLSILAAPIVLWLERHAMPAWLAVTFAMVVALGILMAFAMAITGALAGFDLAVPAYREALGALTQRGLSWVDESAPFGLASGDLGSAINPGSVMGMASNLLGSVVAALSNTLLVALTMMFILLEIAGFPRKLRAALNDPDADLSQVSKMLIEVQRYLAIKTGVSLVTGLSVTGMLLGIGLDFPILWGLIAFLLNYIPTVGSIIAAIPAILISLVQPDLGTIHTLVIAAGYVVVNTVLGNIVEPQLMGRQLGMSPLVVFMSLVFWGWVWGPVGMLLSVPLTMMAKIMLENSDDLKWLSVFLGSTPRLDPELDPGRSLVARIRLRRGVPPEDILRTGVLSRVKLDVDPPSSESSTELTVGEERRSGPERG